MQQIKYFSSAMNDITHSRGWFGKICLLGLILLIPIFGVMVVRGYLYGWARQIAWRVHEPMPAKIFGNEDGRLYRRGFHLLVFDLALALAVYLLLFLIGLIPGLASVQEYLSYGGVTLYTTSYSPIFILIYIVIIIVQMFISWIGSMRISIYGRLSTGFQLNKSWAMYKRLPGGIWRIFGMQLLVGLIIGIALSIVFSIVLVSIILGSMSAVAGSILNLQSLDTQALYSVLYTLILSLGPAMLIAILALIYVCLVASVFIEMLTARALGYWTMQLDVPYWRGPSDPLPFENA